MAVSNVDVQVDLSLTTHERGGEIALGFSYNTALFRHETIERMLVDYRLLLEAVVKDPEMPIMELPLLTAAERDQLLREGTEKASAAGLSASNCTSLNHTVAPAAPLMPAK